MLKLTSPLDEMFSSSKKLILDFSKIKENTPNKENFEKIFNDYKSKNLNPREPVNRQQINDLLINTSGYRYLVGQYGEDRTAMLEDTTAGKAGRVIHMAIDIFSKRLETVYSPCDGVIVRSDYEEGFGEYGNYLIIQPKDCDFYIFFGHLSCNRPVEKLVSSGEAIAKLGDYPDNENGGWSRHLHVQILKALPAKGVTPDGYSTKKDFANNSLIYPNPLDYFPEWKLR
ncbi:MAG TPA: peptidoglycan DD-metalloendopeptidase family protein [Candidatus Saccharimonadales bacterium]